MVVASQQMCQPTTPEFNQINAKWPGMCVHLWDGATVYERYKCRNAIDDVLHLFTGLGGSYGGWFWPIFSPRRRLLR